MFRPLYLIFGIILVYSSIWLGNQYGEWTMALPSLIMGWIGAMCFIRGFYERNPNKFSDYQQKKAKKRGVQVGTRKTKRKFNKGKKNKKKPYKRYYGLIVTFAVVAACFSSANILAEVCVGVEDDVKYIQSSDMMSRCAEYYNGTTYVAYMTHGYFIKVVSYDHETNNWSSPVTIVKAKINTHSSPVLVVAENGTINIFYGCHDEFYHNFSAEPENITAWSAGDQPFSYTTYPKPVRMSNGTIYLFGHHTGTVIQENSLSYCISTTNGTSWSSPVHLANFSVQNIAPYCPAVAMDSDDDIHVAFEDYGIDRPESMYYFRYDSVNATWEAHNGTELTLPISNTSYCTFIADFTSDTLSHIVDIAVNSDGSPLILYGDADDYRVALIDGTTYSLINTGRDSRWDTGRLHYVNDTFYRAYLIRHGVGNETFGDRGGDVFIYESWDDGASWSLFERATTSNYTNYDPKPVVNGVSEVQFIWHGDIGPNCDLMYYNQTQESVAPESESPSVYNPVDDNSGVSTGTPSESESYNIVITAVLIGIALLLLLGGKRK